MLPLSVDIGDVDLFFLCYGCSNGKFKTISKSVNYFSKYDFSKGDSSGSSTCRVYDIQTKFFIFETLQIHIKLLPTVLILIIALFNMFLNS